MKIFKKIKNHLFRIINHGGRISFSQSGEDMMLQTIFHDVEKGIFIDVGANNPFIQSNTNYFYRKGWRGINIDALPNSMKLFNKYRKKDTNLEIAISDKEEEINYYRYSSSFYNSFVKADDNAENTGPELLEIIKIKTHKLSDILDKYDIGTIHFMSIDVEGLEMNVLRSNNWNKYRPKIVIVEYFPKDLNVLISRDFYNFLVKNGYEYLCNTPTNAFFIEKEFFLQRFK
jgi:FkbM family methyltransferase